VDPVPSRTISLVIRRDFIHERMLNVVIDAVRSVIPARMLEPVIQSGELKI
jgi:LysR family hydrogen peroxide-inducible transcriptional activator